MAVSLTPEQLTQRLVELVRRREPGVRDVSIDKLAPLSGGNARRAWSFIANCDGREHDCVLLARVERGQLEVDPQFEFDVLSALASTDLPAPRPIWGDPPGEILGMSGLVMARGSGRSEIAEMLQPASTITGALARDLLRIAARLHAIPWKGADAPWRPVKMLAEWRRQFEAVRMEPLPALVYVFDWLEQHLPAPSRAVLVHGDLRLGNFLHDGEKVTLLLDWELSHLGNPAEDVAWMYRRLWSPEAFLPLAQGVAAYEAASGAAIEPAQLLWYRIFGEARLATISLSAARRFMDGETNNLNHAGRATMANECLLAALRWIEEAQT